MESLTSKRGTKLHIHENYVYCIHVIRNGTSYWRCSWSSNCKGRGMMLDGVFKPTGFHNHAPDMAKLEMRRFKQEVKEKIRKNPNKAVTQVYRESLAAHSDTSPIPSALPSFKRCSTQLYRARTKFQTPLPVPEAVGNSALTGLFRLTDEMDFLLKKDGTLDDQMADVQSSLKAEPGPSSSRIPHTEMFSTEYLDSPMEPETIIPDLMEQMATLNNIEPDSSSSNLSQNSMSPQTGDDPNTDDPPKTDATPKPDVSRIDEVLGLLKNTALLKKLVSKVDDCGTYGEHVANKLKKYSNMTRIIVQHNINNILFLADMGRLESTPVLDAISTVNADTGLLFDLASRSGNSEKDTETAQVKDIITKKERNCD